MAKLLVQNQCKHDGILAGIALGDAYEVARLINTDPACAHQERRIGNSGPRWTPLDIAVKMEDVRLVRMLLDAGAEPCPKGASPLDYAASAANPQILRIVFSHTKNVDVQRALYSALEKSNLDNVMFLLANGADVNESLGSGMNNMTPTQFAVLVNNVKMIEFLLSQGARITPNDDDWPWVICDTLSGNPPNAASIRALVAHGADLDDLLGDDGLRRVTATFSPEALRILLNLGANPNKISKDYGYSALAAAQDPESIGLLLKHGGKELHRVRGKSEFIAFIKRAFQL